jgi:hypothetical protein
MEFCGKSESFSTKKERFHTDMETCTKLIQIAKVIGLKIFIDNHCILRKFSVICARGD